MADPKAKVAAIASKLKDAALAQIKKDIANIAAKTIQKAPPSKKDVPKFQSDAKTRFANAQKDLLAKVRTIKPKKK